MFTFLKLATIAALATSAIASSIPTIGPHPHDNDLIDILINVRADIATHNLRAKLDQDGTVDQLLVGLQRTVAATVATVTDALNDILGLALGPGSVDTPGTLEPLAGLLQAALDPAGALLATPGVSKDAVASAVAPLGPPLAGLVSSVQVLTDNILVDVQAILATLLDGVDELLYNLELTPLLASLGL